MVRERTRGATQLKEHEAVNKEIAFYQECQRAVWRSKDVIDNLSTMRVKLVSMTTLQENSVKPFLNLCIS